MGGEEKKFEEVAPGLSSALAKELRDPMAEMLVRRDSGLSDKATLEDVKLALVAKENLLKCLEEEFNSRKKVQKYAMALYMALDSGDNASAVSSVRRCLDPQGQFSAVDIWVLLGPLCPQEMVALSAGYFGSERLCWPLRYTVAVSISVLVVGGICWGAIDFGHRWQWLITLLAIGLSILVIGRGKKGRWAGIFIDERNMISLSRLQMFVWTCLFLSALVNAVAINAAFQSKWEITPEQVVSEGQKSLQASLKREIEAAEARDTNSQNEISNLKAGKGKDEPGVKIQIAKAEDAYRKATDSKQYFTSERKKLEQEIAGQQALIEKVRKQPLAIDFPVELLFLMGISTMSLAGSPLVRQSRLSPGVNPTPAQPRRNCTPWLASFGDMFAREYGEDYPAPDLGKIQMFVFTLVLVLAYAASLNKLFSSGLPVWAFPVISDQMVWLLGISHAGYLGAKAVSGGQS